MNDLLDGQNIVEVGLDPVNSRVESRRDCNLLPQKTLPEGLEAGVNAGLR